jgi:formamidopyrimidine-DNA glycosylase
VPELPEVENVVRGLRRAVLGLRIESAKSLSRLVMKRADEKHLTGRTIRAIDRIGKHILIQLDDGVLEIHLGMTGKLLVDGEQSAHARVLFVLDGRRLIYDDVRQFGHVRWSPGLRDRVSALGPDAMSVSLEQFSQALWTRRGRIKPLLLNQTFIAGVGNIYADEVLFRARLHPKAIAARIKGERAKKLYQAITEVLTLAIEKGGSSISDYVDAEGRAGSFQLLHRVYGREGEPCEDCGTPIRRIVLGQRSAHFCPRCQKY